MSDNGSEQITLSRYLRDYGTLPGEVAVYAERLEAVAVAGYLLGGEIRRFVSTGGAGKTAEQVEQALRELDEAWDKLAEPAERVPAEERPSEALD